MSIHTHTDNTVALIVQLCPKTFEKPRKICFNTQMYTNSLVNATFGSGKKRVNPVKLNQLIQHAAKCVL